MSSPCAVQGISTSTSSVTIVRHAKTEPRSGSRGEHDRGGEDGEESGKELALTERYDKVRRGAHLVLAYDAKANAFVGIVQNTTDKTLKRVRVEVHLSDGKELGPTPAADLGPGESRAVKLVAESRGFSGWTAHPEVGDGEHGGGEHGGGEDGGGEHGGREHDREHR